MNIWNIVYIVVGWLFTNMTYNTGCKINNLRRMDIKFLNLSSDNKTCLHSRKYYVTDNLLSLFSIWKSKSDVKLSSRVFEMKKLF